MPDALDPACLVVLTTLPDADTAAALARLLVDEQLAACVQQLPPVRSTYRWQGKLETAEEVALMIKTTADRYPALEQALQIAHPYEVPEIIALPIAHGLPAYLDWVSAQTRG